MKLGINVLLDDTYAVSEPKIRNSKLLGTFFGGIRTLDQWGGCYTAHSDPQPGGSENQISIFFFA